jgi:hypothetical protein
MLASATAFELFDPVLDRRETVAPVPTERDSRNPPPARLLVDPGDRDAEHIRDLASGQEGYALAVPRAIASETRMGSVLLDLDHL